MELRDGMKSPENQVAWETSRRRLFHRRQQALLALLLIVPVSSLGAILSMFVVPGPLGQTAVFGCGLWMLVFPLIWTVRTEGRLPTLTKPKSKELVLGIVLGALMFGIILSFYFLWGKSLLNAAEIRVKAQQIGFNSPERLLMAGLYVTFINSLMEEYVWRWFVGRQCGVLVSKKYAIWVSALCFTLHHILILLAYSHHWGVVGFGTLGVFMAGAIWSWCYQTYRSVVAGYISHAAADLALLIISWNVLLG